MGNFYNGQSSTGKIAFGFSAPTVDPTTYQPNWNVLSHICYFSCGVSADGVVSPPSNLTIYNTVHSQAKSHNKTVILCLATHDPDCMDSIFTTYQTTFINNVITLLQTHEADGINLDFEFPRDINSITSKSNVIEIKNFLQNLYTSLKDSNPKYELSLDVPAFPWFIFFKSTEFKQYLDYVFLMAYDYYFRVGTITGPLCPLCDPTRFDLTDTISFLTKYYDSSQIIVGLGFYGYDWPVTSTQVPSTPTGAGSYISTKDAVKNAQIYGRKWDRNSNSPYYQYTADSILHQVWYEDQESIKLKFNYIMLNNLGGFGIWVVGYEDSPQMWNIFQPDLNALPYDNKLLGAPFKRISIINNYLKFVGIWDTIIFPTDNVNLLPRFNEFALSVDHIQLDQGTYRLSNNYSYYQGIKHIKYPLILLPNSTEHSIYFILFLKLPSFVKYYVNSDNKITELTINTNGYPIFYGKIFYSNFSKCSSGTAMLPDCFNKNMMGSVINFLKAYNYVDNASTVQLLSSDGLELKTNGSECLFSREF